MWLEQVETLNDRAEMRHLAQSRATSASIPLAVVWGADSSKRGQCKRQEMAVACARAVTMMWCDRI